MSLFDTNENVKPLEQGDKLEHEGLARIAYGEYSYLLEVKNAEETLQLDDIAQLWASGTDFDNNEVVLKVTVEVVSITEIDHYAVKQAARKEARRLARAQAEQEAQRERDSYAH